MNDKSLTLVPLSIYFDKNFAKVELGLAKAKLKQDKKTGSCRKSHRKRDPENSEKLQPAVSSVSEVIILNKLFAWM